MNGKILVVRGGAIGDFILTLPAVAALRAQFPRAHLTVLGYPHIAQLALVGALADEVRAIEARGLASFFNPHAAPPDELANFFAAFALIISFLYDPDEVFQRCVRRCSRAQFIAGPHRPNEAETVHATEVFLKPLERLAIFDADPIPRLRLALPQGLPSASPTAASTLPSSTVEQGPENALQAVPRIAVHPGSGSEKKNWLDDHWQELLERLASRTNWRLLLVGGEAEADRLERLAKLWPEDRLELARSLPLVELARRLAGCDAFLGHDSGITHLAAAIGLPGLVLWSDSNEAIWRPRSEQMQVLRGSNGLASLAVEHVEAAFRDLLAAAKRV